MSGVSVVWCVCVVCGEREFLGVLLCVERRECCVVCVCLCVCVCVCLEERERERVCCVSSVCV